MMMRPLFRLLSPAGANARLSVLIFHRVLPVPDPLFPGEIDASQFERICSWLQQWFRVLPLDEAVTRLMRGDLPARSLAITFDDGYADNHDVALPILQRHGLPATFYIATGFLDGGRMWNDSVIEAIRRSPHAALELEGAIGAAIGPLALGATDDFALRRVAVERAIKVIKYRPPHERPEWVAAVVEKAGAGLPDDLMMSSAQVKCLREAGMQIGAHTVSHPILATLGRQHAEQEIADSRSRLEEILNERVGLFAYPNGKPTEDYSEESVDIVRRMGFEAAVSTRWGAARRSSDRFQIPRFTPWNRERGRFGAQLLRNLWQS